jgi:hypothetical protein
MFVDTTPGGILVVLGIMISNKVGGLAALTGAFTACITSLYLIQVPSTSIADVRHGLYGYNSAGTCTSIAGKVFFKSSRKTFCMGIFGAMLSVLLLIAFKSFFGKLWNLPVLTFPFITGAWVMMLTRSENLVNLDEHDNKNILFTQNLFSRLCNFTKLYRVLGIIEYDSDNEDDEGMNSMHSTGLFNAQYNDRDQELDLKLHEINSLTKLKKSKSSTNSLDIDTNMI